jgi:hypothetical protein
MALHRDFPRSPYAVLPPALRWFPAMEELRSTAYEKLLPPLVAEVREEVAAWREARYAGVSATSRALLAWWFETEHLIEQADGTQSPFRYYFAQREAVETLIWLYDVRGARDKFDLLRFDASGAVSSNMFDEDWPRFVIKMATGAGKTKVLSLLIAWSYFHKLYEADSQLARNFLLIAPNIIVLDRLRADFDGLRIFFNDPVLPDNGHAGRNWREDFQLALHIQDDVRIVRPTGNLFLTNIHRVYLGEVPEPSLDIALPRLTRRFNREFKDLAELDPAAFGNPRLPVKPFTPDQTREIVFKTLLESEVDHVIQLDGSGAADYRSVVAFFARQLLKDLRLVGGYDLLYPKVRDFLRAHLFERPVDLDDPVILRNLSEPEVGKLLFDHFRAAINALTIRDSGSSRSEGQIRLRDTRPFRTEPRGFLPARKSVFNRIVGEANADRLELDFAAFLDSAPDVQAFGKNYLAVGFKLDYVKANGELSTYTPDFIVRTTDGAVWLVETKGREELDLPQKMARLAQWCADATEASKSEDGTRYGFVYVDQESFEAHRPTDFGGLIAAFRTYQN